MVQGIRMFEALQPALVIARREVRDQFRDWRIIFPIAFLTVFFPFLMNFTAQQMLGFVRQYGANIIGERLVPFLLMIVGFFPISVSLVIALESFVGEKERGSIEPLLSSPLKDWQLYLGKLLSSTVPPLVGSFLGMGVYLGGLAISRVPLPEFGLLVQIIILTIVQAFVMVSGAVVVSTQATSVRAANLLASFIVIPVALLIQAEAVVMFWGRDSNSLWWIVFGLALLTGLFVRVGLAHFQREELLGREIDILNFRWGWRVFLNEFRGGARNIFQWYRQAIPAALYRMRWAVLAVFCLAVLGAYLGTQQTAVFAIQIDSSTLSDRVKMVRELLPTNSAAPVLLIWWQNVRVQIIALILGSFSMGILGVLPMIATMGVVGYLIQTLANNGIGAMTSLPAFILPHGIVELPAFLLATAAILQMGALLATPTPEKTVGEVFLCGLANWFKIVLGVVLPLLLIAAVVEAWVTPQIALLLLH